MRSNRRSSMTSMTSSTLFIDRFPIENDRFTPDDLPFLSSFPLVDSNEGDSRSSNDFSVVHWIFSVWRGISCFCLPLQDLIELDAALNWDLPSFGGDLERDLLNHSGRKTAARSKLCARWVGTEVDRWHSVFFYRVFGNSFIRPHKMSGRHSLDFLHPIALVWQKKTVFFSYSTKSYRLLPGSWKISFQSFHEEWRFFLDSIYWTTSSDRSYPIKDVDRGSFQYMQLKRIQWKFYRISYAVLFYRTWRRFQRRFSEKSFRIHQRSSNKPRS